MKSLCAAVFLAVLISLPASASVTYSTSFSQQGDRYPWQGESSTSFSIDFLGYNLIPFYQAYQSYNPPVGVSTNIPHDNTFDRISILLTNGRLDAIETFVGNQGQGFPENALFGNAFQNRPNDFVGYHIDDISFLLTRFGQLYPNSDKWIADGSISVTVSQIATSVPEPSSPQLLLFGGLMLYFGIRTNVTRVHSFINHSAV
jgi:hypothetical protein